MVGLGATGKGHARRAAVLAASALLCACVLVLLVAALVPAAAQASPRLRGGAWRRRRAACGARSSASTAAPRSLTEKYNVARAALDTVNVRLQEARRDLERARVEFDAAQAQRGERLAAMYKSDGYSVLDVLFSLNDLGEAGTQLGYFRSIDEADQGAVARIAAMEQQIQQLAQQIDADRADALDKEMVLREQQAAIEDELAAREAAPHGPRRARQEAARAAGQARRGRLRAPGQSRRRRPGHHPRHAGADRRRQGDDEVPRHPLRVGRGHALGRLRLLGPRAVRVRQVRRAVPARGHHAGAHGRPRARRPTPSRQTSSSSATRPSTITWASTSATACSSRRRTPATWSR